MKPAGIWLSCLAMAGSCWVVAGCGGSDVPDPSSDASAATESSTRIVDRGNAAPEAAAEPAPAPTPAEPQRPTAPTATAATEAPADVAKPAADTTASVTETPAAATKGDSSGTEEMLRMAAAPAPASSTASAAPASTPGSGDPSPAAATTSTPGGLVMPGNKGRLQAPGGGVASATDGPSGAPAGGGNAGRAGMMAGGEGGPGPMGGPGAIGRAGGAGRSGGPGGPGSDVDPGPRAFQNPASAVTAFLNALKAKNKDRLSQATARRAATEAVAKHQKIFAAILEQSISDEELDDMAKTLEGFQVQSVLQAKSTGQIGVLIGRMDNRDRLQRTVQVRHEKEGWKVMDFGGVLDFKPMGTYRNPNAPGRRR